MRQSRVSASFGQRVELLDEHGLSYAYNKKSLGHVVAGDVVKWQPAEAAETGQLVKVHKRLNLLSRPDHRGQPKPFAANLSTVVLVLAHQPHNDDLFIDQYFAAAHHIGAQLLIFANKSDQWSVAEQEQFSRWQFCYQRIGCRYLQGSAKTEHGLDHLISALSGQTAILVGQSGVGKSSILSALLGDDSIQVGGLTHSGMGSHTTSTARLYPLADDAWLIDSPGVRDLKLDHLERVNVSDSFIEFDALRADCKFRDCKHVKEPICAIKDAVAAGEISSSRYQSYLSLCINNS